MGDNESKGVVAPWDPGFQISVSSQCLWAFSLPIRLQVKESLSLKPRGSSGGCVMGQKSNEVERRIRNSLMFSKNEEKSYNKINN